MAINFDQFNKLSLKLKVLIIGLACILIGYLYYMLFLETALAKKMALDAKLTDLQQQVAEKEKTVAQLDRYIREVNEIKEAFKLALMKLPNEREISGILAAVVLSGKRAGVDFVLFEPKPPEKKIPQTKPEAKPGAPKPPETKTADAKAQPPKQAVPEKFYDEIPIKVQLVGGFHNTVSFFDQVARLPRIVNIEEINMGDAQDINVRGRVVKTSCTMKTYMFVEKK
jgi:type IV pilus assembly protein PilO